jgi:hypothetical protein
MRTIDLCFYTDAVNQSLKESIYNIRLCLMVSKKDEYKVIAKKLAECLALLPEEHDWIDRGEVRRKKIKDMMDDLSIQE